MTNYKCPTCGNTLSLEQPLTSELSLQCVKCQKTLVVQPETNLLATTLNERLRWTQLRYIEQLNDWTQLVLYFGDSEQDRYKLTLTRGPARIGTELLDLERGTPNIAGQPRTLTAEDWEDAEKKLLHHEEVCKELAGTAGVNMQFYAGSLAGYRELFDKGDRSVRLWNAIMDFE